MEKKILAVLLILTTCVLSIGLLPIHGEEQVYDSVIRLHVIANSDEESDQEIKLKVRDAVLEYTKELLSFAKSREEAIEIIEENISDFEDIAKKTVRENGYEYSVSAEIGEEYYPTRQYESVCFPSGKYVSLQIKLGKADGKNWWCVLFPPLCLSAASSDMKRNLEDSFIAVGLSPNQYKIITESENNTSRYKIRFKILELLGQIFDR